MLSALQAKSRGIHYDSHLEAIIVVTPRTQRTKNGFHRAKKKLWTSATMIRGVKQQGEHRVHKQHSKQLQPTGQNPVAYTRVNRGGSKYARYPCRYIQLYIKLESIISSTVAPLRVLSHAVLTAPPQFRQNITSPPHQCLAKSLNCGITAHAQSQKVA